MVTKEFKTLEDWFYYGGFNFIKLLGLKLASYAEGYACLELVYKGELSNRMGFVHGGVVSSLIDSAIATALRTYSLQGKISTVELKINYFRGIQKQNILAEARIIQKSDRIAVGVCEVKDQEERLVAYGSAIYAISV